MKTTTMDAWKIRHHTAMINPKDMEIPIVHIFQAIKQYAYYHKCRYESTIGEDYFLGPAWLCMVKSLRTLLNGDCGRLDCGTIDGQLIDMAKDAGFDTKEM